VEVVYEIEEDIEIQGSQMSMPSSLIFLALSRKSSSS
jgi:hypothetical protein